MTLICVTIRVFLIDNRIEWSEFVAMDTLELREGSTQSIRKLVLYLVALSALVATSIMFGPVAPSHAADNLVTLNSGGGVLSNGSDGIKILYQTGNIQVYRKGKNQIFGNAPPIASSIAPAITVSSGGAGTVCTTDYMQLAGGFTKKSYDSVNTVGSSSIGSGSFESTLTCTVNGLDYVVNYGVSYTAPNSYFTQSFTTTIPAGNTANVRLYQGLDSYLGGSDQGPGYYLASPQEIGTNGGGGVEAIRHVSGPAWAGWFSARYPCYTSNPSSPCFSAGPGSGTDYNGAVDPSPTTDNGFGFNLDLGTSPGVTASQSLFLFANGGTPGSPTNVTGTPGPRSGDVTLGWTPPESDGGSPITQYVVTASPGGSSCTAVAPATSCVVAGLTDGSPYTFNVIAMNINGGGISSPSTDEITPIDSGGGGTETQAQSVANNCVLSGNTTSFIPRKGVRKLMKPGCVTNAGNTIAVKVASAKARALNSRGDVTYYKLFCKVGNKYKKTASAGSKFRNCKKGALVIRTYGVPLNLKIAWHAPSSTGYKVFATSKSYRT